MKSNIFNDDFRDLIKAFNNNEVEYTLVGGYAVILYGYNRTTGDLDLFVNPTKKNYQRISKAFLEFGMPLFDMSEQKFLSLEEYDVFVFGRPPVSVDIITRMKGMEFVKIMDNIETRKVDDLLEVKLIHLNDLIQVKKNVNRAKDIDDIHNLQKSNL
jgi:predicted nucleotidyltransferase